MNKKTLSPYSIRQVILEQSKRANKGHIGSALSIADIIVAMYANVLRIPDPSDPDRDRFVLSKGHAVLSVYAALYLKDLINDDCMNTYCTDDSLLGVHPEHALEGIDFCTGSLGHGLSIAAGASLAGRLKNSKRRIFALVSDAECNEGSLWEAVMFAAHNRLSNLIAIIDLNGQQALNYTKNVIDLSPMSAKWQAFGWDVHEVDGHDIQQITQTIEKLDTNSGKPHVIIANTIFGKGVSFMENTIKWHYWPMSDAEYRNALQEIKDKYETEFH